MAVDLKMARHNWQQELREEREWFTAITTSRDLYEQRQSLRSNPRVRITPSLTLHGDTLTQYNAAMMKGVGDLVRHCDWTRMCSVDHYTVAGDAVVDYMPSTYFPGMELVFYGGDGFIAVVEPTSTEGNLIGLPGSVPAWLTKRLCQVCPLITSYMEPSQDINYVTAGVASASPAFRWRPTADERPIGYIGVGPEMVHARTGLEVLLQHPDWSKSVSTTAFRQGTMMDNDYGKFVFYPATAFPVMQTEMSLKALSRDRTDWFRDFHDRRFGARVPYIQPAWTIGFDVLGPGSAPASSMLVKGSDLLGIPMLTQMQTFVFFVWSNLQMTVHEITGVAASGANTQIGFGLDPLPGSTTTSNLKFACFAFRARQSSDMMAITHQTSAVSSVEISATAVRV